MVLWRLFGVPNYQIKIFLLNKPKTLEIHGAMRYNVKNVIESIGKFRYYSN